MKNLFDLSGKVAIVTGSTKGIGRAIAEQMAFHGARVVISSRKQDACEAVSAEINEAVGAERTIPIPCHIGHKDQLEQLVSETRRQLGQIDILVCNAAVNPYYGSMLDIPDTAYEKIMDSNVKSNHWLCQQVLPEMVERKDGVILIEAHRFRTQERNREDARERLRLLLVDAAKPPPKARRKTKPTRGAIERRLKAKSGRSQVKKMRGRVNDET